MLAKLLPIILFCIGTSAGVGAALFMKPDSESSAEETIVDSEEHEPVENVDVDPKAIREYVKLNNQFVIPLIEEGAVDSLVVISLSVEVMPGGREGIFSREPKLRDSFLRVLFDHASIGGFNEEFTDVGNLNVLRSELLQVAKRDGSDQVTDILILDIAKQSI